MHSIRNITAVFVFFALAACSGPTKLSNVNMAYRYSTGLSFIYPDYHPAATSGDSLRLLFEFNATDLLYVNNDSAATGSYAISYALYKDMESKLIVDSGVHYFNCTKPVEDGFRIRGAIDVVAPDSFNYFMRIDFSDLNRNQAVTDIITIDRTGIQSPDKFLLVDAYTNAPLVRNFNDRPTNVRIVQNSELKRPVFMRYFKTDYPIAEPPFFLLLIMELVLLKMVPLAVVKSFTHA